MVSSAFVLCLVAISSVTAQDSQTTVGTSSVASSEIMSQGSVWRQEVRQAVESATSRLQTNMLTVLSGLANTTAQAGQNVTVALATLTRGIVTNSFDLVGVVAYMPRLLLQDLPTQFTEVLRLIRRNEIRAPSDLNGAIDTILAMTRQAEESGITRQLFDPITRFLPNMLTGIHDFLQTIIGTTANVLGAGVYRYDPVLDLAITVNTAGRTYPELH